MRDRVAARLVALVAETKGEFRADLQAALSGPGRLLGPDPQRAIWPLFPLVFYEALAGDATPAVSAAAAIEIFAAAADLFDDLEDGDLAGELADWTPGRVINTASGLLMLAQLALLEAPTDRILGERWQRANSTLTRAAFVASGGQAADLQAESRDAITIEECLALARDKAGALIAAACQMGAVLATDDPRITELVGEFGLNLGITQQILNDLKDLQPLDQVAWKSDLARRKKTLAICYGLDLLRGDGGRTADVPAPVLAWFGSARLAGLSQGDESVIRRWMLDVGALHFAGLMADVYRRRAVVCLEQLVRHFRPSSDAAVRRLVPTLV